MDEEQILDGLKPVCLCKGIKKKTFLKHIAAGLRTVEELKKATGAGAGPCGGKRCTPRIIELLKSARTDHASTFCSQSTIQSD
jgi:NAD(P)H-nitrite reductase large subunit